MQGFNFIKILENLFKIKYPYIKKNTTLNKILEGIMRKEKLLALLKEAENNRAEIKETLKEKETFYMSNFYKTLLSLIILIFLAVQSYEMYVDKQVFNYASFIDFYTSPVMYIENFMNFLFLTAITVFIIFTSVKINLTENYIKLKWNRKIYFDDIILCEIKAEGNLEITEKGGRKTAVNIDLNHYGKLLLIIKEKLGEKFVNEEYYQGCTERIFPKETFVIVLILSFIYSLNKFEEKIINNYMYITDFSKYGIVKEELDGGEYAEKSYKHGRKNGISRYYYNSDKIGIKELDFKNGEEQTEKTYDKNGVLISETDYYKKREKLIYHPNGKVFIKIVFDENEKLTAPVKIYDDTGVLRIEEFYKKSCDCVVWKIFTENGVIINEYSEENWDKVYAWKTYIPYYFNKKGVLQNEIEAFNKTLDKFSKIKQS